MQVPALDEDAYPHLFVRVYALQTAYLRVAVAPTVANVAHVVAVGTAQFDPEVKTHTLLASSISFEQYNYFASSVAPTAV